MRFGFEEVTLDSRVRGNDKVQPKRWYRCFPGFPRAREWQGAL